jgi:uncharacterized protein (UPF0297 family)
MIKIRVTHLTNHEAPETIAAPDEDALRHILIDKYSSLRKKGFETASEMIKYLNKSQFIHIERIP